MALLPPTLDGFDLEDGLDRMLNKPELYMKFIFRLVDDHGNDGAAVRAALDAGDWDSAHRVAHMLKGSAGNVSAKDLYQAAMDLDEAIKREQQDLDDLLAAFDAELARVSASAATLTRPENT
ncbi:Hpt domain-containing protein [Pseudomonadota bacterium]